ncbi:hypothetical protein BHE74_00056090 [Ensete ventricosum]|nr:hypothetical protein BHE74_00056090 [Ensete ventricosum]
MVGGTPKNTCNINLVVMKKLASRSCLLPDDVLMEILSYLPGKTFFKLLSVCKTFRQLSSNSHFLLSESYHSKAISGFFAQRYSTFKSLILIDPYAGLPRSSLDFLRKRNTRILGSAGGLIFISHRNEGSINATTGSLFVYNPTRRTQGNYLRGGIAVRFMTDDNRLTKDYKLVYLSPTNKSSLHRCQLGTHMLIDPYVFAFNMRTEWTQIIALPDEATIRDFDIIGIAESKHNSVGFIHYRRLSQVFVLWLLRNGLPGWMKAHEISLGQMGIGETMLRELRRAK